MTINAKTEAGITHIAVLDDMTIYSALSQKTALTQHMQSAKEIHINLEEVSEIDSAGLQLLLWLKQETMQKQIPLQLVSHSEAVVEVLELLNLTTFFGDPVVISANWTKT